MANREYADLPFEVVEETYKYIYTNLDILKEYSLLSNDITNELIALHEKRKLINNQDWGKKMNENSFKLLETARKLDQNTESLHEKTNRIITDIRVANHNIFENTQSMAKKLNEILYLRNVSMVEELQRISPHISKNVQISFSECERIANNLKNLLNAHSQTAEINTEKDNSEEKINSIFNKWIDINPETEVYDTFKKNTVYIIALFSPWLKNHWNITTRNGTQIKYDSFKDCDDWVNGFVMIIYRTILEFYRLGFDSGKNKRVVITGNIEDIKIPDADIELLEYSFQKILKIFKDISETDIRQGKNTAEEFQRDVDKFVKMIVLATNNSYQEGVKRANLEQ